MFALFRPAAARGDALDDASLTPFDVTDAAGIGAIMRSLARRRALLSVQPHGGDETTVTQVLHATAATLTLDYASRPEGNALLLRAGGARIDGRDSDVPVVFHIDTPAPCTFAGRLALAVAMPRLVQRFQRREHFRVHVPMARPAVCLLPGAGEPERVPARVVDVSCGGLALAGGARLEDWPQGEIRDCELHIPAQSPLAISLAAVRFIRPPDRRVPYLGCRFVGLTGRSLHTVQRYVHELQRDVLRRAS